MKTVDFSESIEPCNLNVGTYRQLIEFMKVCEYMYSRSMPFLDLDPRSFTYCFSQKPLSHFNQILYVSLWVQGNENLLT